MNFFRNLASGKTSKNVATLMTGTVISVLIPLLTSPISSRLYNSSDYGVLGLYMAISGLVSVVGYAHYQHGILLEKDSQGAKQMIWVTVFFCLIVSVLCAIIVLLLFLFYPSIRNGEVGLWYFFLPLSIISSGVNSCLLLWANRIQQYGSLAKNRIMQSGVTVSIQIGLGFLIKNETGLILGFLSGQMISVLLLVKKFCGKGEYRVGVPDFSKFTSLARKYKGLLFFSAPSEFINTLINQAPALLLQKFAGISYVGNFSFSQRLLGLPQTVLSSAIVEVFRQKASSEYHNTGNCRAIFIKTLKTLTVLAAVPFLFVVLFSPAIFEWVFGAHWREAGRVAQVLSIMYFFRFIISPLTYVYTIAGKFKEDFVMHILMLALIYAAFYIGDYFGIDDHNLIWTYSICYSAFYLVYLCRSFQLSKLKNEQSV